MYKVGEKNSFKTGTEHQLQNFVPGQESDCQRQIYRSKDCSLKEKAKHSRKELWEE